MEEPMSALQLSHRHDERLDAVVVCPSGEVDLFTSAHFRQYLHGLPDMGPNPHLVIDLSETSYIASSGWAVLLSTARALRLAGGKMVLVNMKHEIQGVYNVMDIESQLPLAPSATELKPHRSR
jgi:anti-sigma B factor antagonist